MKGGGGKAAAPREESRDLVWQRRSLTVSGGDLRTYRQSKSVAQYAAVTCVRTVLICLNSGIRQESEVHCRSLAVMQ